MTTLDPRALEAAAEAVGRHIHYSRLSHNCHRCRRTAESAITAYLAVTQPIVETVAELEELEEDVVLVDRSLVLCHLVDSGEGLVWLDEWGNDRPVLLPARVIWRPHDRA